MIKLAIYGAILFGSVSIGRIGHILGWNAGGPNFWIYGLIALLFALFIFRKVKKLFIFLLIVGVGLMLSDYKDMISLNMWGLDDINVEKFWSFD